MLPWDDRFHPSLHLAVARYSRLTEAAGYFGSEPACGAVKRRELIRRGQVGRSVRLALPKIDDVLGPLLHRSHRGFARTIRTSRLGASKVRAEVTTSGPGITRAAATITYDYSTSNNLSEERQQQEDRSRFRPGAGILSGSGWRISD